MQKRDGSSLHMAAFACVTALVLAASGCGSGQDAAGAGASATRPAEKPTPVEVTTMTAQRIVDRVTLPGNVEGWCEVDVATEVPGRIAAIDVKEGQRVAAMKDVALDALTQVPTEGLSAGELRGRFRRAIDAAIQREPAILRLDHDEQMQGAIEAGANAALKYISLRRVAKLHERKATTDAEMDQAGAAAEVAMAQFRRHLMILSRCAVGSSIAGVVDHLPLEVGEFVQRGDVVARVVQADRVKVVVDMPERDVPYVHVGDTPQVRFDFLENEAPGGKVIFVGLVADRRSRTFPVQIELGNADGRIRPGMIARVTFIKRVFDDAMVLPLFAIQPYKSGYAVFVVEMGRAVRRPVELGILEGVNVQITSGLATGDRVVVKGQRQLEEGKLVEVRDPAR